jgi:tetratricopeptide (TPR) repeat protein
MRQYLGFVKMEKHSDSESYFQAGKSLFEAKKYEEARQEFEKALTCQPEFSQAQYWCGRAYSELGQYQTAIEKYQSSIELSPDDAFAYLYWGHAASQLDNTVEARQNYLKAVDLFEARIALDSSDFEAYHGSGEALFYLERYQKA